MKVKSKKSITKRFTSTNPKRGKGKVMFESPGFAHGMGKKRKFRVFKGKHEKKLQSSEQARKIQTSI